MTASKQASKQASKIVVSISGGRTSAYMANWMMQNREAVADHISVPVESLEYIFLFANTGQENDDTLRFLNDIDKNFGLNIVWLESIAHFGQKKSSTHRVTDYKAAYRRDQFLEQGHPFHAYIRKYGVPNVKFKSCTRELKLNPIKSYMRETYGLSSSGYHTAIGIRADERRRVSATADVQNIIYPLVDLDPVDKQDVIEFWNGYEWDLAIPEWQGNCVTCFKKSFKKLCIVHKETPEAFEFNRFMETSYSTIGAEFEKYENAKPRSFFRLDTTTANLIKMMDVTDGARPSDYIRQVDAGCSESCEMYETEQLDIFNAA